MSAEVKKIRNTEDPINLANLEISIQKQSESITNLITKIDILIDMWGKAVPIKLVFYIVSLIIAGQTAVQLVTKFIK